jgi:midasin (ATPase involved in ribosome maturation)
MSKIRDRFFNAALSDLGNVDVVTRQQILDVCENHDLKSPAWFTNNPEYRAGRGKYSLKLAMRDSNFKNSKLVVKPAPATKVVESADSDVDTVESVQMAGAAVIPMNSTIASITSDAVSLVPSRASGYVPFGHYNDVRKIIGSTRFYPMYITGLSGNGKTMMVEQVCAIEKRECIRVNITIETDEDDLLGGFRLIDGRTVWQNGPVINAMERGAVLLLDEVDLGSNKLMCLQPVLEGKAVFLKKINKLITPAKGFTIVATANTKGKGSEDGRFIGTNVMNEAFLERFSITLEQEYPAARVETKILKNVLSSVNVEDADFVKKLVNWAEIVRKTFLEGGISEIISTRRLVHICEAYGIFNDKSKAIALCLNRFDPDTKRSFMELYDKLDDSNVPVEPSASEAAKEVTF